MVNNAQSKTANKDTKHFSVAIFGRERECIPVGEFVELLPSLIKRTQKFTSQDRANLFIMRHGLVDGEKQTLEKMAKALGVSPTQVLARYSQVVRCLKHPAIYPNFVTDLDEQEQQYVEDMKTDELERGWIQKLSKPAEKAVYMTQTFCKTQCSKDDYIKLFSDRPNIKYKKVAYPSIAQDGGGISKYERIPIAVYNEIRIALGIAPYIIEGEMSCT